MFVFCSSAPLGPSGPWKRTPVMLLLPTVAVSTTQPKYVAERMRIVLLPVAFMCACCATGST